MKRVTDQDLDDPIAWGRRLIETRDIDPIYDMLWEAQAAGAFSGGQLKRWLVAYWCLYHAGAASFISEYEGEHFWRVLGVAARNAEPIVGIPTQRWPRASERRHWRGANAVSCVEKLSERFPVPELMVDFPADDCTQSWISLKHVIDRVKTWPQFGPWIAFKVADMLERVVGFPIEFPGDVAFYESPRQGAIELATVFGTDEMTAVQRLWNNVDALRPPGRFSRNCGVQEVETVLCKWKSARGGHYFIGKDLLEIRHGLAGWGTTATNLLAHLTPPLNE